MRTLRVWRSAALHAAACAITFTACTDLDPAGPHADTAPPRFSGSSAELVFRRLDVVGGPAVIGGAVALQAVAPIAAGHVVVNRADQRYLSLSIGTSAVVDGAFDAPAGAVPAANFGAAFDGATTVWSAGDAGSLTQLDRGVWTTVSYACGNCQTHAIWTTGPSSVWAGGGSRGTTGNAFIRFFDGTAWTNQAVPGNAGGIWGIWGSGATRWAVGELGTILRGTGTRWDRVTAPSGLGTASLRDVHGTGPADVWAVGDGGVILHFNGSAWRVAARLPQAGNLYAVQAISPTQVYVAGNGLFLWNGSAWSQVNSPALAGLSFLDLRYADGRLYGATAQGYLVVGEPPQTEHHLTVETDVAGVTVTAVNVLTGDWFVACTDAEGRHTFVLEPGSYLVHARNLRICAREDLTIWPEQQEGRTLPPTPPGLNLLGVIWSEMSQSAVALTPANYQAAVATPLVLPPGFSTLPLPFGVGNQLSCVLLDLNGAPLVVSETEQVFIIMPFLSESGLPPIPNPLQFPRGIGIGIATIPQGSSAGCVVGGLPAGEQYVLETNQVQVGAGTMIYRGAVTLTGPSFIPLGPQPLLFRTEYLYDPLGDGQAQWDLGELITFGWGVAPGGNGPSDHFIVAAGFASSAANGQGIFEIELRWTDAAGVLQTITARAVCNEVGFPGCRQTAGATAGVSVSGSVAPGSGGLFYGTVVWSIHLPGVNNLQFRLKSQSQGETADTVPDTGWADAAKPTGTGTNTFIIAG